jgi:hypothetical protein
MEERVMSVDVFRASNLDAFANAAEIEEAPVLRGEDAWRPELFAQEQVRGLVRQVFFSSVAQPVRQVVFSAVEERAEVARLCRQVGEALALETKGRVAILSRELGVPEDNRQEGSDGEPTRSCGVESRSLPPRYVARQIKSNLWMLTEGKVPGLQNEYPAKTSLYSRLCELRAEFDYSIVEGPPAGLSSEAAALAQLADGIVLVLTAHKTRRAAAIKIKETLEAARTRILGTVLSERTFSIPAPLYRRL